MHVDEVKKLLAANAAQEKARAAALSGGNYQATGGTSYASRSPSMFDGSKWHGGLSASGVAKMADHQALRRNTRNALFDSTQANTITTRIVDSEIDTGLKLDSNPVASMLGISDEEAEAKGDDISQRFHLWAMDKKSILSETHNFYQEQWTAGLYQQRDNDFLLQLKYSKRRDLLNPLQVKLIDPDQLIGCGYTDTYGLQNLTADGIERNVDGKELAYWLQVLKADNTYGQTRIPAVGARSGRRMMLHAFRKEFAGQGTGYSMFAHALQNFENLTDFELSHIMKAINQSSTTHVVVPSKDADAHNFLDQVTQQPSGPSAGLPTPSPTGDVQTDVLQFIDMPEATITTPGSVVVANLRKGEDLKVGDQNTPIESYAQFVDSFTSYLSASKGMPIEVMLMKFGQNYSASRATLLLFWNILMMWRSNLVADILHPVYEAWLSEEVASGRINLPGWSDPRMKSAWLAGKWNGTPLPNIDPVKSARANQLNIEMGATTPDAVARETNGSDGRANRAKNKRQLADVTIPPWKEKQGGAPDGKPA